MIKALSIRQPWAYAIVHEGKNIENRSRPTKYRGPLAIHAPARPPYRELFDNLSVISAITFKHEMHLPAPSSSRMPYGGIIGVCEVVDCVTEHGSPWFTGPYGYVLANVRKVPFYKCPGNLGLFNVDVTLEHLTAPRPEVPRDPACTVGDLRAAERFMIMTCRNCKYSLPMSLFAHRSIPDDVEISQARKYLSCPRCESRNIETRAEPLAQGRGAQGRGTQ